MQSWAVLAKTSKLVAFVNDERDKPVCNMAIMDIYFLLGRIEGKQHMVLIAGMCACWTKDL